MRSLLALFACLMLVMATWSGTTQAAGPGCSDMAEQATVPVAGGCDEVPAHADKNYPHCHTGCHDHHMTAPIPARSLDRALVAARSYGPPAEHTLTAYQVDRTLRPPQA